MIGQSIIKLGQSIVNIVHNLMKQIKKIQLRKQTKHHTNQVSFCNISMQKVTTANMRMNSEVNNMNLHQYKEITNPQKP